MPALRVGLLVLIALLIKQSRCTEGIADQSDA